MIFKMIQKSEPDQKCKGLFFRNRVNSHLNELLIITKKTLILLKRSSCNGCDKCDGILNFLTDECSNNSRVDYTGHIENNCVYKAQVVMSAMNLEDRYPEIDHIEFIKVDESFVDKNTVIGVSKDNAKNQWRVSIGTNSKNHYLGLHDDFNEAVCTRFAAEQCLGFPEESSAHKYVKENIQCR